MRKLAQRDLSSGLVRKSTRAQADTNQVLALLASLVHGLVGGNLGLVVGGEDAKVDLFVVLLPLVALPPWGSITSRAVVGDEKEFLNGWDGSGGLDKVNSGVAIDLVGLERKQVSY